MVHRSSPRCEHLHQVQMDLTLGAHGVFLLLKRAEVFCFLFFPPKGCRMIEGEYTSTIGRFGSYCSFERRGISHTTHFPPQSCSKLIFGTMDHTLCSVRELLLQGRIGQEDNLGSWMELCDALNLTYKTVHSPPEPVLVKLEAPRGSSPRNTKKRHHFHASWFIQDCVVPVVPVITSVPLHQRSSMFFAGAGRCWKCISKLPSHWGYLCGGHW